MPLQGQIDAAQELWRRFQANPAILNEDQSAALSELRKRWRLAGPEQRLEVSTPPPISREPQFEPAAVASTAQQITPPPEPEPAPQPQPRPQPAFTAAPETPKLEFKQFPHPIAGARGRVTLPTPESILGVVNHWMRKHITGEMVSIEAMEQSTGIPKGILNNVWRSFKRVAPAGVPFMLEAAEGISKAPVETLKQFAMYPLEWGNRLQIMTSPYSSPYDKRKAAEEWAEDPLGPLFALGIAKGGIKATGAAARKIPAKGRIAAAEAVKPEIKAPVEPVKPVEAPVIAPRKQISAARSAAVRKRQADYIVVDPKHLPDLPAMDAIQGINMARDYPDALAGIRVARRGRNPVGSTDILNRKRTEPQNYDLIPLEELPARFQELYGKESVADASGVYVDMGKLLEMAEQEARSYLFEGPEAAITKATGFGPEPETIFQSFDVSGLPPLPEPVSMMQLRAFTGIPDPRMVIDAVRDISRLTSEMTEGVKMPPKVRKGFKAGIEAMTEHDRMIRQAEATGNYLKMVIDKNVPKERQLAMVHAYEHKMTGPYWEQLNSLEQSLTKWIASEKSKLNKFIDDNKVLERMEEADVNHIFHHWINPETSQPYAAMYGKFSKGLPQAKQRTVPTYEAGIKQGLKPATTNVGELVGLEWQSAMRSHQSRQMFGSLNNIGAGVEGGLVFRKGAKPKPLRMVERWDLLNKQGLTEGYERYHSPYLDKSIAYKDAKGNLRIIKGPIGIRKEIYNHVRAYLESPSYNAFDRIIFATKSLKLGLSLFHVTSLAAQNVANWRAPLQGIIKGKRLVEEGWGDPTIRLLYKEGLELKKGYEDVGYRNTFFEGATELGKAGNVLTKPIELMRDFIFDVVQPRLKTQFVYDTYNKILPRYKEWGKKKGMSDKQIEQFAARKAVQAGDGHFSGEHWKRSLLETNRHMAKLYFSPEYRAWWQRLLLSPTWQREHLIVAKRVAQSLMPEKLTKKLGLEDLGPIRREYRQYALGGAVMVGAVDLMNQMFTYQMDGEARHLWENPEGKGFAVRAPWDEPDYTVWDKNGKPRIIKGGPAYFRPLKSIIEVAESVVDFRQKVAYKLSPMITAIISLYPNMGDEGTLTEFGKAAREVATPISVAQWIEYAKGKKSLPSTILPSVGFPTSRFKKPSRRKMLNEIDKLNLAGKSEEAMNLMRSWNRDNPNDLIVP